MLLTDDEKQTLESLLPTHPSPLPRITGVRVSPAEDAMILQFSSGDLLIEKVEREIPRKREKYVGVTFRLLGEADTAGSDWPFVDAKGTEGNFPSAFLPVSEYLIAITGYFGVNRIAPHPTRKLLAVTVDQQGSAAIWIDESGKMAFRWVDEAGRVTISNWPAASTYRYVTGIGDISLMDGSASEDTAAAPANDGEPVFFDPPRACPLPKGFSGHILGENAQFSPDVKVGPGWSFKDPKDRK